MKTRFICSALIALSALLSQAHAAEGEPLRVMKCEYQLLPTDGKLPFSIQTGHIVVSDLSDGENTLVLPSTVSGYPDAHVYAYKLTSGQEHLLLELINPGNPQSERSETFNAQTWAAEITYAGPNYKAKLSCIIFHAGSD